MNLTNFLNEVEQSSIETPQKQDPTNVAVGMAQKTITPEVQKKIASIGNPKGLQYIKNLLNGAIGKSAGQINSVISQLKQLASQEDKPMAEALEEFVEDDFLTEWDVKQVYRTSAGAINPFDNVEIQKTIDDLDAKSAGFFRKIGRAWEKMSVKKRVLIVAIILLTILATIAVIHFAPVIGPFLSKVGTAIVNYIHTVIDKVSALFHPAHAASVVQPSASIPNVQAPGLTSPNPAMTPGQVDLLGKAYQSSAMHAPMSAGDFGSAMQQLGNVGAEARRFTGF